MEPEQSTEVATVTESMLSYRALTVLTVLLVVVGIVAALPARGDASSNAERSRVCAEAGRIETGLRQHTAASLAQGDVTPAVLAAYHRAVRRASQLAAVPHQRSPRLLSAVRGLAQAYRSAELRLVDIRGQRQGRLRAIGASVRLQNRATTWALYFSCGPTFR